MTPADPAAFAPWLADLGLTPDGAPFATRSSRLLPVRTSDGAPAMLKIAVEAEERAGAALMSWWDGEGAARALAQEGDALLLERATGPGSLAEMARSGRDDEASRILCAAAASLHAPRELPTPDLVPLERWFASLWRAREVPGLLGRCAATARALLDRPQEVVPLHGDLHHGNVLDFGARGWLAIDPKGLIGERGFDHANLFCNPDHDLATTPGRLARQVSVVSEAADLEPRRLLQWILVWSGLSALWMVEDGETAEIDLSVTEIAAAELDR